MMMSRHLALTGLVLALAASAPPAHAADPASCQAVRFADVGWTDITSTTASVSTLLSALGYKPKTDVLALPVTFASMKNKDIDVFLGNWMPTMEADLAPYKKDGSIETVRVNLEGAKYTLAVPTYLYNKGLKSFADIGKFYDQLGGKIYGIEPGNDGNRLILKMIADNKFGLGKFELVESSEQGMLSQVARQTRGEKPVVFLGWDPIHELELQDLLPFGRRRCIRPQLWWRDDLHPSSQGIYDRVSECGQTAFEYRLLAADGKRIMGAILNDGKAPEAAAKQWLAAHPETWKPWLDGVTTFDGKPAEAAVSAALSK